MRRYKTIFPILILSVLASYLLLSKSLTSELELKQIFKFADWITYNADSNIQYFRKGFNISQQVENATLTVSSLDRYELYLNGDLVGKEIRDGRYPSKIYDISNKLILGRNVISLRTAKRRFNDSPKVIAELFYSNSQNNRREIYTNESWKTADYKKIASISGLKWFDNDFDDSNWSFAQVVDGPKELEFDSYNETFQFPVDEKNWFWVGNSNQIKCSRIIEIKGSPENSWIRVSSWGDFSIDVNGNEIQKYSDEENSFKTITNQTIENQEILYLYDITSLLKKGKNKIDVYSYASESGKGFYIDGLLKGRNWEEKLSSQEFHCNDLKAEDELQKNFIALAGTNFKQKIFRDISERGVSNFFSITIFFLSSLLLTFLLFLLTFFVNKNFHIPLSYLLSAYLLPTLYLVSLILLTFDSRLGAYLIYKKALILIPFGLLFLIWIFYPVIKKFDFKKVSQGALYIVLLIVLVAGVFLRFQNIQVESLHWDEAQMSEKVEGVLEKGFPSLQFSDKTHRYISTSELVVYIQSFSVFLFGNNEFSLRFSSLVFGILTIILLYYCGTLVGDRRVGILCATAYAIFPPAIGMSVFARYPSQLAFFSLLSCYFFLRYVDSESLKHWILSAIFIVFSYFTWQASALIALPILVSRTIFVNKKRLLRDSSYFIIILAIPIFLHIIIKKLSKLSIDDYALMGPSLSLTSFKLNFLSSLYDPFFYIRNYLFVDGFYFFSILFFIGVPVIFFMFNRDSKYKKILVPYFILIFVLFLMTLILANNSYRYAFYLTPYLIIIACVVFIYLIDFFYKLEDLTGINLLNFVFAFIFFIFFVSGLTNGKNFSWYKEGLRTDLNLREFPNFKKSSSFLRQNVKENDVVISLAPHLSKYYFDKINYFFESRLPVAVFKGYNEPDLRAYHKVISVPAILSVGELKNVIFSSKGNVWLIASPERYKYYDEETIDFLENNRKLVFESYDTKIYLLKR